MFRLSVFLINSAKLFHRGPTNKTAFCPMFILQKGILSFANHIRSSGFCIINCNAAVRSYILKVCHMQTSQRKLPTAKDDISPKWWLCEEHPFTYCGVDIFGPFCNQGTLQGAKALWGFAHMLIQQSHPHWNSIVIKYRFFHLVFMQICWSQRKHQTSNIR